MVHAKKLTKGQRFVLLLAATPMAAAGVAGGIASYFNFATVLTEKSYALSLVLAGEGATFICALVALAVTLMGQGTPAMIRLGLWILPAVASVAGVAIAPTMAVAVVMALSPLGMAAAGEGIAFTARRIVAHNTGVDLEAQRRTGLLVWHANRARNGGKIQRMLSKSAVWRLSKAFAASDAQMAVQVDDIQRFRISENLDANLTAVMSAEVPATPPAPLAELAPSARKALTAPEARPAAMPTPAPVLNPEALTTPPVSSQVALPPPATPLMAADDSMPLMTADDGMDFIREVLSETEARVEASETPADLLTVAQVAHQKNVSPSTVRSWIHRKKLDVAGRDGDGRALISPLAVSRMD